MEQSTHRGGYSRTYLPHSDRSDQHVAITYRLHDALPSATVRSLARLAISDGERRKRIEQLMDAGHGSCLLRHESCARIVVDGWKCFAGVRYDLIAWVVMPNHVHILVKQRRGWPLGDVIGSWKSFTAKAINHVIGSDGRVWQREYWDRTIRDEAHLASAVAYIHENPVSAFLARDARTWRWSSAFTG